MNNLETMKKINLIPFYLTLLLCLLSFQQLLFPQYKDSKDPDAKDYLLFKENTILDRAGGIHNASNIGLFFENRGKLYPRRLSQGPSGEFPINSGKHYIYRINPMVGIPNNVVQGRYTTNEEWEAVGGYHNNQGSRIAFSDNPLTWHPQNGWPLKDKDGNPLIKSDQDSYCVYSDSLNNREVLGITVAQTGYAYGIKFAQNILFFKYEIINNGKQDLSGVYFNLYSDIDIGDVSGGLPEYGDDKLGFDKQNNFVYFYDDGVSGEWPDGKTGQIGVALLQTPKVNGVELGLTDMHYNIYNDDRDVDSIQYYIMSSSPALYNSPLGSKYFHIGNNTSLNFDDPATIPASGLDLLANLASGPYELKRGDTLTFLTAVVAGETHEEMYSYLFNAQRVLQLNFELSKPPATPKVSGFAGDKFNLISWDDAAERSKDNFSGQYDFEGYRIYRSIDKGVNWKLLADFDIRNDLGIDRGLQYSYTDTEVNNGFEYWYSVTSYDRGDSSVESLESPRGKTIDAVNNVVLIPSSSSIGRTPVSAFDVKQIGTGISNYEFRITPFDDKTLAGNEYKIGFTYSDKRERGVLHTRAYALITDSSKSRAEKYGMYFKSPTKFDLVNMTTGENIKTDASYVYSNPKQEYTVYSGFKVKMLDSLNTPLEFLPKAGDLLTLDFSIFAVKNNSDTVIAPRGFLFDKPHSTSDGVVIEMLAPDIIRNYSRVGGTDDLEITFTVDDPAAVKTNIYLISTTAKGFDSSGIGFISLEVKDTALNTVLTEDSVYALSTVEFHGISAKIDFTPGNPPAAGNIYSLETVLPVPPNIMDAYTFKIKDAVVNSEIIREKLKGIKVVPNPYVVSSLFEPEFGELRREPLRQIQFINLPPECTIYIFSMDADMVKTINHSSTAGTATWDLRGEGGREFAPGIYIYVVKSPEGEFKDKFAIIK